MNISRAVSRIVFSRHRYHQSRICLRILACGLLAFALSTPQFAAAANSVVRMVTTLGTIDIQLYDDQAPKTVVNFLRYAGRGDYTVNGFIHRSMNNPKFVLQGGGYTYFTNPLTQQPVFMHILEDAPVQNEFSRSNVRGTIAMAKLPGNPDSATSEWFFNLADNSANLDYQNGGFTVFGNVIDTQTDPGMTVVDAIANLPTISIYLPMSNGSTQLFGNLPVYNYNSTAGLQPSNLVMVTSIPNVTAAKTWATGTTSAYAADVDMTLSNPFGNKTVDVTSSASWLGTFTPPLGKTVQFNDEISQFKMTWPAGSSASRVVTLYHGANASVNGYYAYGPTLDNPTPHWYDFSYDGQTGAEIVGNKILLHFVDGARGDDDLAADGSITHTGAPVLVTDINTGSSGSVGCSIAATPSTFRNSGDWIVVAMFLAFVALVRRRNRRGRTEPTQH